MKLMQFLLLFASLYTGTISSFIQTTGDAKSNVDSLDKKFSSTIYDAITIYKEYESNRITKDLLNDKLYHIIEAEFIKTDKIIIWIKFKDKNIVLNKIFDLGIKRDDSFYLFKNYMQCAVPIESLEKLKSIEDIIFIEIPPKIDINKQSLSNTIITEGFDKMNAQIYHQANFKGSGIKIAILDRGFDGYAELLGNELPSNVITKSFYGSINGTGDISGNGEDHGTKCAEIIFDIAPEAVFYFVNSYTIAELFPAIDYLIEQQVDIISFSAGIKNTSFYDGTGIVNEKVNEAISSNIFWVNSAGNSALSHWFGSWRDQNNNDWIEFDNTDEYLDLGQFGSGDLIEIYLTWNDWPNSYNDYDLHLYANSIVNPEDTIFIKKAASHQIGSDPVEYLRYVVTDDLLIADFYVKIKKPFNASPKNFHLYVDGTYGTLEYNKPTNSLLDPATIFDVFTVGAIHHNESVIANYSSRGPTSSGVIKPDITGWAGVTTSSGLFNGTSSAAPHVSGAVALLMSSNNNFNNNDIKQQLKSWAIKYQNGVSYSSEPNTYGSGLLYLNPDWAKIKFSTVILDRVTYKPNEYAIISAALDANLAGASVQFKIANGNLISCNEIGNGQYSKTFSVPPNTGLYEITVYASKEGYQDAVPYKTTLTVTNPNIGHDFTADYFTVSKTNISPGGTVKLNGRVKNIGDYREVNVPVVFSLKDPNGNTVDSETDHVKLDPGQPSLTFEHYLSTSSSGPQGNYTAEIRSQLNTDYDPSNDFLTQSIFVGQSANYKQYEIDYLTVLILNNPYSANGYTHTLTWGPGTISGKQAAKVKIQKSGYSREEICYINELTFYDNNNYALIYRGKFGTGEGAFESGKPINPQNNLTVAPNQLRVDAGTIGYYNVASLYNGTGLSGGIYGVDASTVDPWLDQVGPDGTNFDIEVKVPTSATRRTYSFWPNFHVDGRGDYVQVLSLIVGEPHNITAISLSPSNGFIDTVGKTISIKGIFKNNGGYDEENLTVKLEINGPNGFSYISNESLNINRNLQDTAKFSFNTVGLSAGSYTLKLSAVLPNDPYIDNNLTSTINLVNPPPPSIPNLTLPLNNAADVSASPLFSWSIIDNANYYSLQVATDNNFTNLIFEENQITSNQKQVGPLNNNSLYFWRVKAINNFGSSVWSEVRSFTTVASYSIIGNVTYCNIANSAINDLILYLKKDNYIIQIINTSSSFNISSLNNGSYLIDPILTATLWGGANSTDALLIRKYLVGEAEITDCKIMALDVNASGNITSADPLLIRQRIVGNITSFPAGDWKFEYPEVIINNENVNLSIKGICVGDVNGSYMPSVSKTNSLIAVNSNDKILLKNKEEFILPISVNTSRNISAITLFLNYPEELVDFISVRTQANGLISRSDDGIIKIAWDDINPLKLNPTENIIELVLKPKTEMKEGVIAFSIAPESEFADENANVIENITLNMPSIEYVLPKVYSLNQNYPNPFNPSSKIEYIVPEQSKILIEIFNLLGERINVLVDEIKSPGNYVVEWNANNLPSGIYIYRMMANGQGQSFSDVKKMMLLK